MPKVDLRDALKKKANPSTPPPVNTREKAGTSGSVQHSRVGKRQIAAYFPEAAQKQLKLLAVERDSTIQKLLAEALNDLFAKYGKPEIAQ